MTDDRAMELIKKLSPMQRIISASLVAGLTSTEAICEELHIMPGVVRNMFTEIYTKLGVENRAHLVLLILRNPNFEEMLAKFACIDYKRLQRLRAKRYKVIEFREARGA